MNRHVNSFTSASAIWLLAVLTVLPAVAGPAAAPAATPAAAPVAKPATTEVVSRSVFVLPTNPKEGRDPFFPDSSRPYEGATSKGPVTGDVTSLVLKGISGPPDHLLAIINNHTFGSGDEGDVLTSHGRIHIHCLEIKAQSVVIEFDGLRHELIYNSP